jgi:LysM repeat protein
MQTGVRLTVVALTLALILAGLFMPATVQAAPNADVANAPAYNGGCSAYHYVRYGQTLSQISMSYGVSMRALMRANGIQNPNQIYAGQKLCIPGGGMQPMPPMPPMQPGYPSCKTQHTVRWGETLSGIAQRYGVSAYAIMKANGIWNGHLIYAGQTLCIPGGGMQPMPPKPMPPKPMPPKPMPPKPMPPCGQPQPCPPPSMPPCSPCPQPPMPPSDSAWTGAYYNNKYFEGAPVFTRQDPEVRFNWYTGSPGDGMPNDRFSVRWERTVNFPQGSYRFLATSDDGVRVYIDDIQVIDGWNEHPATEYAADVYIYGGPHKVVVEYYEEAGEASIYVRWGMKQ